MLMEARAESRMAGVDYMDDHTLEYAAGEPDGPLKNLKVLVLDEQEITRRTLALILDAAGASVTCANSLSEALAFLSVRRFDAILTDVDLPGIGLSRGRPVLAGIAGPNALAPVLSIDGRPYADPREPAHAAGMMLEIGSLIDPARICRDLTDLAPRPPRAAAA